MSKTILKNTQSELVVKIVNEDTIDIDFADGDLNGKRPQRMAIKRVMLVKNSDASVHVLLTRDPAGTATLVMDLPSSCNLKFDEFVDNELADKLLNVSIDTAGNEYTLFLTLSKEDLADVP